MKTFIQLFFLLCLVAFARTQSEGMGYPQDMFADNMTAKENTTEAKASSAKPAKKASRATGSGCTTQTPKQALSPCKKGAPCPYQADKKVTQPAKVAQTKRMESPFQKINLIVMRVFGPDDQVEDQIIPADEWKSTSLVNHSFAYLFQILHQTLFSYLAR
jgi:hypothetical protein